MIKLNEVRNALGQVLTTSGLFPRIVWANRDAAPAKPYIVVNLLSLGMSDKTLRQNAPVWSGALLVTAVTGIDEFDTAAMDMAWQVAGLFPAATRHNLPSGQSVIVSGHPAPATGYRDAGDYRLPVSIPLRQEKP